MKMLLDFAINSLCCFVQSTQLLFLFAPSLIFDILFRLKFKQLQNVVSGKRTDLSERDVEKYLNFIILCCLELS